MRECLVLVHDFFYLKNCLIGLGVEDVDGVEVPVAGHHATDAPVW